MPAPINLKDQMFGNLKVIEKIPSRNGHTYWHCQCQICQKEYDISTNNLRNGSYKKCCEDITSYIKEDIRICPICGEQFIPKALGQNRRFCFTCSPSYDKKEGRSQNVTAIRRAIKKRLVEYKGGKCECCGYDKCIQALQFHHLDPNQKDFSISASLNLSNFNMEDYYKEVDKCQLLCANCHTEKHAEEWI